MVIYNAEERYVGECATVRYLINIALLIYGHHSSAKEGFNALWVCGQF